MIIDPDFLDHWRTRMLVDALKDEMAPIYVMRLWAHCQTRKSDRFAMPPAGLKAQCRAPHDAATFEQAVTDAGFVQREGAEVVVLGWAEQNASLLAAWENGSKGGRPRKEPAANPDETPGKPEGNQEGTQGKPDGDPGETDKRGSDKTSPSLRSGERATSLPKNWELPQPWAEWARSERPDLDPVKVAAKFADYWHGKGGKEGRKLDWLATWRNWIRDERAPKQGYLPEERQWFDTQSGVERKAAEFGIKPWNEMEEQWPQYRQRVMKAEKGASQGISLEQLAALAAQRQTA